MATSVPEPMAIPTSALVSAGASLTPSPTIATNFPSDWSCSTFVSFSSGRTSAKYWSIPSSSETALATSSESPVSIATSMSIACSASIACRLSSRITSASERECCDDFGFVVNQIDDRLCVRTGFLSEGSDAVGSFDTEFLNQVRSTDMNRLTVHGGSDAETAKVLEVRNARSLDVSFLGGVPDGASDHVFGVTLDTSGDFERSLSLQSSAVSTPTTPCSPPS